MLEKSIKRKIDTNVNPVKYHFPGLQHGKIITTLFASIISAILSVNVKGKFQDAAVWSRGSGRGFKSTQWGYIPRVGTSWHGVTPQAETCGQVGGLASPVIQVYGRPNSVTLVWWGLNVLSNERRLMGECKCPLNGGWSGWLQFSYQILHNLSNSSGFGWFPSRGGGKSLFHIHISARRSY